MTKPKNFVFAASYNFFLKNHKKLDSEVLNVSHFLKKTEAETGSRKSTFKYGLQST